MRSAVLALAILAALSLGPSIAVADSMLVFDGEVPADGDYFEIAFEVPAGTAEIEVRHDDLSEANILDWGLFDAAGFRGYGGGNTEPAIVNAEAASRSYLPGAITAGTWRVYVGKAKIEEPPGSYHVEVLLRDAITLAPEPERAPYVPVPALSADARWYAGDFHVHSRESGDASATLEEIASFAETHGLDFVMLSEHNTTAQLERIAEVQAAHPELLFVPGIEVTTYQGHAMSIGGTTWIDHRVGVDGITHESIADAVHADGALFSLNHPSLNLGDACIGCGWDATLDGADIDAIEIQTGAYSVTGTLVFPRTRMRWESLVAAGHHVIALGGSDDHSAGAGTGTFDSPIGSPTTMVFAEELSVAGLMEGLRRGRTVVKLEGPDDPMIEILEPDLSLGNVITSDVITVRVRVTGAAMGAMLRLVRDGVAGPDVEVMGDPFEHEETMLAGAGESFVRAELRVGGQPRVITNHFFFSPSTPGGPDGGPADGGPAAPPSGGGCGCRAAPARSAPGLAVLALVALAIRRRPRNGARAVT